MYNDVKRESNLVLNDPINYTHNSRYQTNLRITNLDTNETYLETTNNFNFNGITSKYHVVEPVEEGRLDMISQIYYDDPSYGWVIAMANNIVDPFTVLTGTILKIPEYNSLFYTGGPFVRRTR